MKENKSTEILLFAFGLLFAIIGYLMVDKLSSINNSMSEIKTGLDEARKDNSRQDKILWKHNSELNLPEDVLK